MTQQMLLTSEYFWKKSLICWLTRRWSSSLTAREFIASSMNSRFTVVVTISPGSTMPWTTNIDTTSHLGLPCPEWQTSTPHLTGIYRALNDKHRHHISPGSTVPWTTNIDTTSHRGLPCPERQTSTPHLTGSTVSQTTDIDTTSHRGLPCPERQTSTPHLTGSTVSQTTNIDTTSHRGLPCPEWQTSTPYKLSSLS